MKKLQKLSQKQQIMKRFKAIRFFAWIDLVLGLGLALPKIGTLVLQSLHELIMEEVLVLDAYHLVLMQVLGIMIVLWALVRLRQTAIWQISYDCIGRVVVCAYLGFYCYNGQAVVLFFIIIELLGFYQLRFLSKENA